MKLFSIFKKLLFIIHEQKSFIYRTGQPKKINNIKEFKNKEIRNISSE